MKRIIPHIAFFFAYAALLFLWGFIAEQLGLDETDNPLWRIAPFVAAPLALLVAMRLGDIGSVGVAVASVLLVFLTCAATVAILVAIAVPIVGGPTPGYVWHAIVTFLSLGGWPLLSAAFTLVAAPVLWSVFLQARRRAILREAS
jgi:hypothetical protein